MSEIMHVFRKLSNQQVTRYERARLPFAPKIASSNTKTQKRASKLNI
jgi:hypothetical protein